MKNTKSGSSSNLILFPTLIAILIVAAGSVAAISAAMANETMDPSIQIKTGSQVSNLGSAPIQVDLSGGNASSSYWVTIQVAPPAPTPTNNEAGGPFCVTFLVPTDASGNGNANVTYPDTGNPANNFAASDCVPAGAGGPSTLLPGTYTVTASIIGFTSPAPITFTVLPRAQVVTGTGTFGGANVKTYTALPAAYTCTGSDVGTVSGCTSAGTTVQGYMTCSGTTPLSSTGLPSTKTLPTTYPSTASSYGTQTSTGLITTNTPGQGETSTIYDPCATSIPGAIEPASYANMSFQDVTVALPNGGSASGGLTVQGPLSTILLGAGTSTTTSSNWDSLTVTGFGGLAGVHGTCMALATVVTTNGVLSSITFVYSVQLTFPASIPT